jgi:hypothetical protein
MKDGDVRALVDLTTMMSAAAAGQRNSEQHIKDVSGRVAKLLISTHRATRKAAYKKGIVWNPK